MASVSDYERLQIDAMLHRDRASGIETDSATTLILDTDRSRSLFEVAVQPALRKNGLNPDGVIVQFDSGSPLGEVYRSLMSAEVIVADATDMNPDMLYVIGLCHGLGRCPILIATNATHLPFNLPELRCVEYRATERGFFDLRNNLERVVRVFLAASRATRG